MSSVDVFERVDDMPKEPIELDRSPTPTPYQTRTGSPDRGTMTLHSAEDASLFMTKLHDLVPEDKQAEVDQLLPPTAMMPESETNCEIAVKIEGSGRSHDGKMLLPVAPRKDVLSRVSALDGSAEVSVTTKVKLLIIYFLLNLGLTLYNKAVMNKFTFPFLLTALHAAAGMIGTQIMLARGVFSLRNLTRNDGYVLSAFSVLYTANIAISNVSLSMVSVPFHQTVRASTPVFTVAIYRFCFSSVYDTATYISLVPVILGVMLASYGELDATVVGFFLTLLGTILAAVKTVATNRLQTAGLHLGALELLYRMSPVACLQSLIMAYLCGELGQFQQLVAQPSRVGVQDAIALGFNGIIAFALNVISFDANRCTGALTMTIAANVKQVLTVILAVMIWHIKVGSTNACGIALTLIGGAWYGRVEVVGKSKKPGSASTKPEEGQKETV